MFYATIEPDLVLRLFEQRHTDELLALFRSQRTHLEAEMPWLAQPFSQDDVRAYIQAGLDRFAANNGFRAGIWWRGQLVGCLSLHSVAWADRKASLGYWLAAPFQGNGIITRGCRALIAHAFSELELERLEIQCAMDNERSRRIALRLGFQQEGIVRQSWRRQGQLVDQVVYGLLRDEWQPDDTGAPLDLRVSDITRHAPAELFDSRPFGFSQIVVAPARGRLIHLSGQVAWDANRQLIGKDDLTAQVIQSLRNIEAALRHVGAELHHVVALRLYIRHSHIAQGEAISTGLRHVFGDALPCATWIGVPSLANPDFLVEIEPTVVAP